jgi:hypothetical protein
MRQRLCRRTTGYLPLAANTRRLFSLSIMDVLATTENLSLYFVDDLRLPYSLGWLDAVLHLFDRSACAFLLPLTV